MNEHEMFEAVVGDFFAAVDAIDRTPYVLRDVEERRLRAEAQAKFDEQYEAMVTAVCTAKVEPKDREITEVERSARSTTTTEIELRAQRLARQASEAGDARAIQSVVDEAHLTSHDDTIPAVLAAASDRHRALTAGRGTPEAARAAREAFELGLMTWRQQHPTIAERLAKLRADREATIAETVRQAEHVKQMALARARKTSVSRLTPGQA